MAKHRIAVLGCGYVGSALGRALAAAGHDCIGTTTSHARTREIGDAGDVKPVVMELSETSRLHERLRDRDKVFLTVAPAGDRREYQRVYLEGAKSLLQSIEGTNVSHVVYTSSTGVYGQQDGSWVDERSPTDPQRDNARILLETERCLLTGARLADITVTILRLGGIYGPGRDPAERIAQHAGAERTDGDAYVNMVHRNDIVSAMLALLNDPYHGVLNLTDDHPTTRREYYDHIITAAKLPPIRWVTAPPQGVTPNEPPALGKRVRNDLIKRTLNLTLEHPTHC